MTLTAAERLILATNLLILERLGPPDGDQPEGIDYEALPHFRKAVQKGYEWEYDHLPLPFEENTMGEREGEEVRAILKMFDTMQIVFDQSEDKQGVSADDVLFPGFDYEAEPKQYSYADYILNDRMLHNARRQRVEAGSRVPHLDQYRRMHAVFIKLPQHEITLDGIKQVLAAGK